MDGIIVINKPQGCTSHDVVYKVKKIFKTKVGHTGTLDPNATGVLPLLIGKGTQLSKYLINHDKTYEVTLKLGIKTDTADGEGAIIEQDAVSDNLLNETFVMQTLQNFLGKQTQIPPMFSAIKVNGKKLYEYARKGEKVELEPRNIEIYNIDLISIDKENKNILFRVNCSKGTYIRSLCEDISAKLGTIGYMEQLNRTEVGKFCLNDAITVEELEKNIDNKDFIDKHFTSIESFFADKTNINLNEIEIKKLLNGVKIKIDLKDGIYRVYNNSNQFVGTATVQNKELKRDIIL